MKCVWKYALGGLFAVTAVGCTTQVETTDDSVRFEAEVPKVERGEAPLDADPSTDEDLDVDTPVPGDR